MAAAATELVANASAARDQWQVIDRTDGLELGGAANPERHRSLADSGSAAHLDLARIASKYLGETEKNIGRLLGQAQRIDASLLFDETDALFGKRTEVHDSHDRYASLQASHLLQHTEPREDASMPTTHGKHDIDPDVFKRLQALVPLPHPPKPRD